MCVGYPYLKFLFLIMIFLLQFTEYVNCYYCADSDKIVLTGRKEVSFLGNLCAFQFWQRVFKVLYLLNWLRFHPSELVLKL